MAGALESVQIFFGEKPDSAGNVGKLPADLLEIKPPPSPQ
jgi:hypothetical protein